MFGSGCEHCRGKSTFVQGPRTSDGHLTWRVVCEAGRFGGCPGPGADQIAIRDIAIGGSYGAQRREPLLIRDEFGKPIQKSWQRRRFAFGFLNL